MHRFPTLLALALFPGVLGCYEPDRATPPGGVSTQQPDAPADDPSGDDCDGDCEVCASYCAVQLVCAAEPSSAEECALNCLGWLELGSPACADAYRDAAACIGALDCAGYDDPTTCVPEIQRFHDECDDEAAAEVDEPLPLLHR